MITLLEAHAGPDSSYYGERGDWLIVVEKINGADAAARSNFDAAIALLSKTDPQCLGNDSDETWAVETSGHWVVGWLDRLVVQPNTKSHEIAKSILASLEDYPLLDEDLCTEYEVEDGVYDEEQSTSVRTGLSE